MINISFNAFDRNPAVALDWMGKKLGYYSFLLDGFWVVIGMDIFLGPGDPDSNACVRRQKMDQDPPRWRHVLYAAMHHAPFQVSRIDSFLTGC